MDVDSVAIGLIILPLTFIDVTVCMPELALAVGLVLTPFSLVFSTVGPHLSAGSVSQSLEQVAYS